MMKVKLFYYTNKNANKIYFIKNYIYEIIYLLII